MVCTRSCPRRIQTRASRRRRHQAQRRSCRRLPRACSSSDATCCAVLAAASRYLGAQSSCIQFDTRGRDDSVHVARIARLPLCLSAISVIWLERTIPRLQHCHGAPILGSTSASTSCSSERAQQETTLDSGGMTLTPDKAFFADVINCTFMRKESGSAGDDVSKESSVRRQCHDVERATINA